MLRLLAGEAARRFGGRAAVVAGSTVLTFADLDRLSDQVAAGLAHRGTRIGDVVALALPDGPEFVICYVAAAKIDAVTAGIGTERPELLARLDPALVLSAGAPAPPELIRALRDRYRVPVCNRYICSEAGLGLGTRPDDPPEDAEVCVGRPRDGVDVSIRNADGRVLSDEDEGEVLLRSEAVMSGYVGKSIDHAVFARDGFIRTGDRGYLDHTGRLHLVGRV
ncbi:AMP-binding protein [Nonomuraea sp. JJY05]|uniref:AMP-binding protein n=1 Tax=Nonomuraea sp. JJY05 TaxID=3350255 RepID=UPI00373F7854